MLRKLKNKIESKRNSESFFWRALASTKDYIFYNLYKPAFIDRVITCYHERIPLFPFGKLFYKKRGAEKTRIKIIPNYYIGENPKEHFKRFCQSGFSWNNLVIVDSTLADYYVVINHPRNNLFSYYNPEKTIVFQCEPISTRKHWGYWNNLPKKTFFYFYDTRHHHNIVKWHLSKSYDWLNRNAVKKTKLLSTVTSDLYSLPGHKKRLDFLPLLDQQIEIDIYGKTNPGRPGAKPEKLTGLKHYQGPLPPVCKDDGLFPYKYTFAAENSREKNYFTEKIVDAILAECLCFYWGCPNLEAFIDSRAFIRVDLDNFEEAIKTIQAAIKNREWEKRIEVIKKEKKKILNELQIMPTIERIIKEKLKDESKDFCNTKNSV